MAHGDGGTAANPETDAHADSEADAHPDTQRLANPNPNADGDAATLNRDQRARARRPSTAPGRNYTRAP